MICAAYKPKTRFSPPKNECQPNKQPSHIVERIKKSLVEK